MTVNNIDMIMIIIMLTMLGIAGLMMAKLQIELYFLKWKIEKHPVLIAMVDDVLKTICEEENIKVFYKSFDELNVDIEAENEKALGMYVYTFNKEFEATLRKSYDEVRDMEFKHGMKYNEICRLQGIETKHNLEDFTLPKILLCKNLLMRYGLSNYYSTYFHEIGHHFAVKTIGKHNEEDANILGHEIIFKRLPFFFQLFPDFNFKYREGVGKVLTAKEKIIAMFGYLKYYVKNIKTIKRKK